jgi:hypothetical protein
MLRDKEQLHLHSEEVVLHISNIWDINPVTCRNNNMKANNKEIYSTTLTNKHKKANKEQTQYDSHK